MRISIINEATYPFRAGGVSHWCDVFARATHHDLDITTVVDRPSDPIYTLPDAVSSVTALPMWQERRRGWARPFGSRALRPLLRDVAALLFPEQWDHDATAGSVDTVALLEALVHLTAPHSTALEIRLRESQVIEALCDAPGWRGHSALHAGQVGHVLTRILWAADRARHPQCQQADLIHATCNGVAGLIAALHAHTSSVPSILTEHGVYLRERYIEHLSHHDHVLSRRATMHVWSALARITYQTVDLVTSVADANYAWLRTFGVERSRYRTIHNGVSPHEFPLLVNEPAEPTVVWVGHAGPMKDLHTLMDAMATVRQRVPQARLLLYGPRDDSGTYAEQIDQHIERIGLSEAVTWCGAIDGSLTAMQQAQVVVLSSISEGLPYTVMEAMMTGRATVSTDVGGVHEIVGTDANAGLIVPPREAPAMADAITALLNDSTRRRTMGLAAHQRARRLFTETRCVDGYHRAYLDVTQRTRDSSEASAPEHQRAATTQPVKEEAAWARSA